MTALFHVLWKETYGNEESIFLFHSAVSNRFISFFRTLVVVPIFIVFLALEVLTSRFAFPLLFVFRLKIKCPPFLNVALNDTNSVVESWEALFALYIMSMKKSYWPLPHFFCKKNFFRYNVWIYLISVLFNQISSISLTRVSTFKMTQLDTNTVHIGWEAHKIDT